MKRVPPAFVPMILAVLGTTAHAEVNCPSLVVPTSGTRVDASSSAPVPGAAPEVAPPTLDLLRATFEVTSEDSLVSASVAPFAIAGVTMPILNDARVEAHTGGTQKRSGFVLSSGFRFSEQESDADVRDLVARCGAKSKDASTRELLEKTVQLEALLKTAVSACYDTIERRASLTVVAWKREKREQKYTESESAVGDKLADELLDLRTVGRTGIAKCVAGELDAKRSVLRGFTLRFKGGMDLFPFIHSPKARDSATGVETDLAPNVLAGYSGGLDFGFLPSKRLGFWLSGAGAATRSELTTRDPVGRVSVGLNGAYNIPFGEELGEDGFQSGFAVGAYARGSWCLVSAGCDEEVLTFKDPVQMKTILTGGVFVDVRASTKLQVRFALPVDYYRLAAAPLNSDGGRTIVQLVPTLSLTVATWKL